MSYSNFYKLNPLPETSSITARSGLNVYSDASFAGALSVSGTLTVDLASSFYGTPYGISTGAFIPTIYPTAVNSEHAVNKGLADYFAKSPLRMVFTSQDASAITVPAGKYLIFAEYNGSLEQPGGYGACTISGTFTWGSYTQTVSIAVQGGSVIHTDNFVLCFYISGVNLGSATTNTPAFAVTSTNGTISSNATSLTFVDVG